MMQASLRALLMVAAIVAAAATAEAQPASDPRVADIVRAGKIRVGMHLPQFVQDPKTGEIHGHGTGAVIIPVARALAARLGVELQLVGHPTPPVLVECLKAGECDIGFLGFTPQRTKEVDFAPPHMMVPFTYLVAPNSAIRTIADADNPGVRIAVIRNHVSTLTLNRLLQHATTLEVTIPDQAFELVRSGNADAYASPRPPILEYAKRLPGSRVLDGHFGANIQAIALPKGQAGRIAYVSAFVEEAKASGLLQKAIDDAGERGMVVAPSGDSILTGAVTGNTKH